AQLIVNAVKYARLWTETRLEALRRWLETEVCPSGAALEATIEPIDRWCWARKIQPPSKSASQARLLLAKPQQHGNAGGDTDRGPGAGGVIVRARCHAGSRPAR
ncbi:hypothetical protein, partial [Mesorhizobium sp.]|uniref:hypothetical protein n=1 Tax=Mesorhizobium sp. TaxID=1871066 RepID=UPI0025E691EB